MIRMRSIPYEPRAVRVNEATLDAIFEAARIGLRGDNLALACARCNAGKGMRLDHRSRDDATLDAVIARRAVNGSVPAATLAAIRAGQHPDGGWDYTGDLTTATPEDINTSASALLALVAGGATQADPAVVAGLAYLAGRQDPDGGWREDGDAVTNPNATALSALATGIWLFANSVAGPNARSTGVAWPVL